MLDIALDEAIFFRFLEMNFCLYVWIAATESRVELLVIEKDTEQGYCYFLGDPSGNMRQ